MRRYCYLFLVTVSLFLFNTVLFSQDIRITKVINQYGAIDKGINAGITKGQIYDVKRIVNNHWVFIAQVEIIEAKSDMAAIKCQDETIQLLEGDVLFGKEESILNELLGDRPTVTKTVPSKNVPEVTTTYTRNKLETWYTYWGLGYANITYPKELNDFLDLLKGMPEVTNIPLCLDMFGFYWPRGERTMWGVIINGWGDRYQVNNEHMQINGYLYSISFMNFINNRIGDGFFIRGDFGAAMLAYDITGYGDDSSELGYGGLFGIGYGIPISSGTRLLLNINYSIRHIVNNSFGSLQISVGGLF